MKRLRLKWAAKCRDCGAALPAGTLAKWYGRGRIYGIDCHDRNGARTATVPGTDYTGPDFVALEADAAEKDAARVTRAVQREAAGACAGEVASLLDRYGAYTPDGVKIGSGCGCEDYPCCGH